MRKCALRLAAAWLALAAPATAMAGQPAAAAEEASPIEQILEGARRGDFALAEAALRRSPAGSQRVLLESRLAAARYREGVYRDPRLAALAAHGSPADQRSALAIVTSAAFSEGEYRAAALAAERLAGLLREAGQADAAAAVERTRQVAAMFAAQPGQRVEGAPAQASTALRHDAVGLPRIDIAVNGTSQEAVVDTGANLSVLSLETARQLGVTIQDAGGEVGNGVGGTVPVRIGVADRVTIAGTTLRNVAMLIIDDSQLTFPVAGGYRIRAIVGLPVLRALERIRLAGDRFAVEAPQPFEAGRQNLYADNNNLYLRAQVGGRDVPLHLDTGANRTMLSPLFAAAHPDLVATLGTAEQRLASAGGARQSSAANWTEVDLAVAGRSVTLPQITIALPAAGADARNYGTIGNDALRRFGGYAVDFRAMRLEPEQPTAP